MGRVLERVTQTGGTVFVSHSLRDCFYDPPFQRGELPPHGLVSLPFSVLVLVVPVYDHGAGTGTAMGVIIESFSFIPLLTERKK